MCRFITLIATTDDLERINRILATLDRRGDAPRRAEAAGGAGLRPLLVAGERVYRLARQPCDCGTFLGHAARAGDGGDITRRAAEIAAYRRKGWPEARIARAVADRDRAAARPPRQTPNEDAAYWANMMILLGHGLGLRRLGLMHRFHGNTDGAAPPGVSRQAAGPVERVAETLACMAEGVIHDFEVGAAP